MWWAISVILAAGLVALWLWLRDRKTKTKWYDLAVGMVGMLLLIYAIHNFSDFMAEHETVAAWNGLFIFGIPALVLLVIPVVVVLLRQRRKTRTEPVSIEM